VKAESEGPMQREARTCPVCGTKYFATADREFCPVCILNKAFGAESKATGEAGSVSESAGSPGDTEGTPQVRRFEHYEVMLDEAGRQIELGRGAMGVTYKALDVDLRCPVTLKVISDRPTWKRFSTTYWNFPSNQNRSRFFNIFAGGQCPEAWYENSRKRQTGRYLGKVVSKIHDPMGMGFVSFQTGIQLMTFLAKVCSR